MATRVKRPDDLHGPKRGRGKIRPFVAEHRGPVAAIVLVLIGIGVFGFLWFRPDKIFIDTTVDEAAPTAPAQDATQPPGGTTAEPAVLSSGSFRNLEHETSGTAKIIQLADGSRIVRLEDFRTSSGPDVVVILSSTPATEDNWSAYDDGGFVNLGALRGNVGNQNYAIKGNVDLGKFRSVVIWCRRFNVAFGAAPISDSIT